MAGVGAAALNHGLADADWTVDTVYKVCAFLPLIGLLAVLLPDFRRAARLAWLRSIERNGTHNASRAPRARLYHAGKRAAVEAFEPVRAQRLVHRRLERRARPEQAARPPHPQRTRSCCFAAVTAAQRSLADRCCRTLGAA